MLASMDDAHREWHRNTGVPMGTPGCPQDACDAPEDAEGQGDDMSNHLIVPILEGVVIGHASCMWDGCTAVTSRVVNPYALEIFGEEIEVDVCEAHLRELCDDI